MRIINDKDLKNLLSHRYSEESFRKFDDPSDPQYKVYKSRKVEKATDAGFNMGLECAARLLESKWLSIGIKNFKDYLK